MTIPSLSRRSLLMGSVSLAAIPKAKSEEVYVFTTAEHEIRMSLEFHDNYGEGGLHFRERSSERRFCLSQDGEEDRNCVQNFRGAITIARYRVSSASVSEPALALRESVRSIDRSASLPAREPFERVIQLRHGLASDIQAFGYQVAAGNVAEREQVWCLFRQDLYLQNLSLQKKTDPFLVLHWKHTLSAIRVLDMIPGDGTSAIVSR